MFLLQKANVLSIFRHVLMVFIVALFLLAWTMNAQAGELSAAPVNPDFIKYVQGQRLGLLQSLSAEGNPLGYVPPPIKLPRVKAKIPLLKTVRLPVRFDLREMSGTTPVKDQGSCGSCWAFATLGSLQSYLEFKLSQMWDFSEAHLNENHGFDPAPCSGGNELMTTAYLARWDGPVNESDFPNPYTLRSAPKVPVRRHVQSVWLMPDRNSFTDNSNVKTAVMTFGAVYVDFHWEPAYFNTTHAAYYDKYSGFQNHAVTIVGWDDSYPKSKFNSGNRPPGNGAFLAQNSWGPNWGDGGYFYISYYDKSLEVGAAFNNAKAVNNYKRVYEYDPLGWIDSLGYGVDTAWFANVFTASANAAIIKAVSFYTPVPSCPYEIYIYEDVMGTSDPINGILVKTVTGIMSQSGYQTVAFGSSPVPVTAGKKFSIVVKLTTPGYNFPISIESYVAGYSSAASAFPGESFVSSDGTNWDDLTTVVIDGEPFDRANVCLKAFGSS